MGLYNDTGFYEGGSSSGGAEVPGNIITVAKEDGDHSSIQSAISSSTANDTILIYPGTYSESVTTKAGGSTTLVGMGTMGSVIIESNTGTALTVPATPMSMAFIKNLKLKSTATGNNASKLFVGSGMMTSFNNIAFDYNIEDGYTEKIIELKAGSYIFTGCKFDLDSTGTSGGETTFISCTGSVGFNIMQGFATMDTASIASGDHLHFISDDSSGYVIVRDFDCTVSASSASFAGHLDFMHSGNTNNTESMGNKISITTPSGAAGSYGQVYHLVGTGGGHVHSASNRIEITGFADNYIGNIGSTETLVSHFDDIVAEDGIIGTGTYSYVNSPEDGDLQMSGNLVRKLVDITANYANTESWEWGILNSNATSEITATFNTTAMSALPNGAVRTFTNSSSASNFIIDPATIEVGYSTTDRVIYPNGYIVMEKIADAFIIIASYNTSFNINIADVPNKTFHLDFSDASSVTTSGDDITAMTESINTVSGTGHGYPKYGLTTQNGLNTGLWNTANSDLNFGDIDLHSNTAGRGLTIITVCKPKYSGDAIISKYANNVDNREWRLLTNSAVIFDEADGDGNEASLNFSSNYEEWQIVGMTWEPGGRLSVYKNGYLMGNSAYTTADIEGGTADLLVGLSDISGMDYYGEIGEIIAISDTPTEAAREAMVSKLGAKWGIDTAVFSASDSSPFGRDEETSTIKPIITDDNLDLGNGNIYAANIVTGNIASEILATS